MEDLEKLDFKPDYTVRALRLVHREETLIDPISEIAKEGIEEEGVVEFMEREGKRLTLKR